MRSIIAHFRNSLSLSLLAVLFNGISLVSLANGDGPVRMRSAATAEVKYIAVKGDGLFNVTYDNVAGGRFSIAVLDEYGNQLYQGFFSDRKFDRYFKLADPEIASKLIFVIHNYGDKTVQRFQVDATSRLIEDVQVNEVH